MTREEARAILATHGTVKAAARAAHMRQSAFGALLKGDGRAAKHADGPKEKKAGRSLQEFRSLYDKDYIIPTKIKAALREIAGSWEYEVNFAKIAGLSLADLGSYRDQFADYVVTLRESRRVWAGTAAMAKTLKGML